MPAAPALALLSEGTLTADADAYLIKETMKLLVIHAQYPETLELFSRLSPRDQSRPMVQLQYAAALAGTGKFAEAEAVLLQNGGLELPDGREGDVKITSLFLEIEAALGRPDAPVPLSIDYRTK
jgi:predicted Zn-dependent protease